MKLVIGIPTAGSPTSAFLTTLNDLRLPENVDATDRVIVTGNFAPGQRELIVKRAREMDADILVMLDDDMVLPPDALMKIIETLESDTSLALVGGLYYSRDGQRPMVVNNWQSGDTTQAHIPAFTSDAAVRVDGIGFGCIAMRMTAIRGFSLPIFSTQVLIDVANHHVRVCNEDYLLCERLRYAGWQIALDARVRCGHFDRASATQYPVIWESDELTGIPRMFVREVDGQESLAPLTDTHKHAEEQHLLGTLDFLVI